MRWNPFLNAFAAAAYVWGIASLINYIGQLHRDAPGNLIGSVAALSLGVFSAAVMGFFFFYRPVMLLLENKKGEAIKFFLATLLTFGGITFAVVLALL